MIFDPDGANKVGQKKTFFTTAYTSVDFILLNTKGADEGDGDVEDGDDEDDRNGDVVEYGGGLVVLGVVDVQPGQHQEEYAGEDLEKSNVKDDKFKTGIF